jgi:RimJ/RimL family protein N-acetyltransferase
LRVRASGCVVLFAALLASYAFTQVGPPRLVAVTFPENIASRRVLEKVGFVHDGMSDYKTLCAKGRPSGLDEP